MMEFWATQCVRTFPTQCMRGFLLQRYVVQKERRRLVYWTHVRTMYTCTVWSIFEHTCIRCLRKYHTKYLKFVFGSLSCEPAKQTRCDRRRCDRRRCDRKHVTESDCEDWPSARATSGTHGFSLLHWASLLMPRNNDNDLRNGMIMTSDIPTNKLNVFYVCFTCRQLHCTASQQSKTIGEL